MYQMNFVSVCLSAIRSCLPLGGPDPSFLSYEGTNPSTLRYNGTNHSSLSYDGTNPSSLSYVGTNPSSLSYVGTNPSSLSYDGTSSGLLIRVRLRTLLLCPMMGLAHVSKFMFTAGPFSFVL